MGSQDLEQSLARGLTFLFEESVAEHSSQCSNHHHHHHHHSHDIHGYLQQADTWHQLQTLRALLCQRSAVPPLPPNILEDIERVQNHLQSRRLLVPTASIPAPYRIPSDGRSSVKISLWRGDITALQDVTAIVNAANSAMLGCFKPAHRCIDNVIHAAAGPRLRAECNRLMVRQGHPEPIGSAKVTPGYCAPTQYILHTVGPQLNPDQQPSEHDKRLLASCYKSCLDELEHLPPLPDGRLIVAFPCISTGVFCFPGRLAAQIAVDTVISWCKSHPDTPVTHVIFDVFLEKDAEYYQEVLDEALSAGAVAKYDEISKTFHPSSPTLQTAREWIYQAEYLLITAGAGLSAAAGFDFTSQSLFRKHFPAFQKLGLRRLYDTFGWDEWPSKAHRGWGFYFTQLQLARTWPASSLYTSLLELATSHFDGRFFVRTSNADGFFPNNNGFPEERFSSPQGAFRYLQCMKNCRPDAYFRSKPYLDAALPFIDHETGMLTDDSKIPVCEFCGGEVYLCVRAGNWFNERPFEEGEERYQNFLDQVELEGKTLTILELGVGMSTPGVIRWPNEELVRRGEGKIKLVRGGEQAAGLIDFDLEAGGNAIGIEGHISDIVQGIRN
ncbi:Appr-1-p processing [Macrophomina phaseolina MS6]|uniref:Appr-1-p processing n=1 Tax=Macrophomina phaseolina (strain MS6) TaxID=1126212 RepID=K2S238_MACPH|nr:Appr-1-p processing [Macrophomina phaseolina MS6]